MLCQHCKSKEANTHIVKTVNGHTVEMYLCDECAKENGYGQEFSMTDFLFGNMFSSPVISRKSDEYCPLCHTSFYEISESGNVGCGQCYSTFKDRLMPTVSRLHTLPLHKGKNPKSKVTPEDTAKAVKKKVPTKEEKIAELRAKQKEMIKAENFEKAAEIRDEIKKIEGGEK